MHTAQMKGGAWGNQIIILPPEWIGNDTLYLNTPFGVQVYMRKRGNLFFYSHTITDECHGCSFIESNSYVLT